jgi:hypothetical protein
MQTVMGGISEKFSDAQQREVGNYGQIISANSCQRRNFFISNSQYTAGGPESVQ